MDQVRNGLYAVAIAIVASTIIFSVALTSAAGTVSEGLAQVKVGIPVGTGNSGNGAQPTTNQQPTPEPTVVQQQGGKIDLSNAAVEGKDGAKVVLVEYSDFQCPFCSRFYSQAYQDIKKNYLDTGKIKIVYKNFPLDSIHPNARPAAVAFECAREQDSAKAWLYHNKLFENQGSLGDASYKAWAKELGLKEADFNTCYDSKKTDGLVSTHFTEGAANGIRGTPGFLVTDASGNIILPEISGAQPYAVFEAALNQALGS